jgi:hypothetical protein
MKEIDPRISGDINITEIGRMRSEIEALLKPSDKGDQPALIKTSLEESVIKVGHLGRISPRINFFALSGNMDWLEIWEKSAARLNIHDDHIHINCWPLVIVRNAINSISIYNKELPDEKLDPKMVGPR